MLILTETRILTETISFKNHRLNDIPSASRSWLNIRTACASSFFPPANSALRQLRVRHPSGNSANSANPPNPPTPPNLTHSRYLTRSHQLRIFFIRVPARPPPHPSTAPTSPFPPSSVPLVGGHLQSRAMPGHKFTLVSILGFFSDVGGPLLSGVDALQKEELAQLLSCRVYQHTLIPTHPIVWNCEFIHFSFSQFYSNQNSFAMRNYSISDAKPETDHCKPVSRASTFLFGPST